jgi:xylan 1,4-beta-xylosidase
MEKTRRTEDFYLKRLRLAFMAATAAAIAVPALAETVVIDSAGASHPFPHFWEQVFGSGRANLALRESYRRDLRAMRSATAIQYVRFHAIFHDENGVYDEDAQGRPVYNFSYVDQIYDGLLEDGVRPFVELSFMPAKLSAAPPVVFPFWYKPLVSPPKDYGQWGGLVRAFAQHLVDRYGIDEVAEWYFEVWNEPNIFFWAGKPQESTYYQLYAAAARALKGVDKRLRVGGPATAQAAWVDHLIAYTAKNDVPIDFVSTHVYGNDRSQDVFGTDEKIARRDMVARAARKVFEQVKHSALPDLPIHWTEYNASYSSEPAVTDTPFMGPWLANNIRLCDGLAATMSYWTFSDVFEEGGVVKTPFYGGFGLFAERGIPKAAFHAFRLLHQLGNERLNVDSESVLATRRADGALEVAAWNYAAPEEAGSPVELSLLFKGLSAGKHTARIERVDSEHGSPLKAWEAMGRPASPSPAQIAALRSAAQPGDPETVELGADGALTLHLRAHCLAMVEVR